VQREQAPIENEANGDAVAARREAGKEGRWEMEEMGEREGKGREGKGREWKGREGKGREGKGVEAVR
jgi:hypothetical protein